jgi:hypothetical protein
MSVSRLFKMLQSSRTECDSSCRFATRPIPARYPAHVLPVGCRWGIARCDGGRARLLTRQTEPDLLHSKPDANPFRLMASENRNRGHQPGRYSSAPISLKAGLQRKLGDAACGGAACYDSIAVHFVGRIS